MKHLPVPVICYGNHYETPTCAGDLLYFAASAFSTGSSSKALQFGGDLQPNTYHN